MYKAINTGVRIIQAAYFLISIGEYVAARKRQIQARKEAKAEAEKIFQEGFIGIIQSMHERIGKQDAESALSSAEAEMWRRNSEATMRRNNQLEKELAEMKEKLKSYQVAGDVKA